MTSALQHWFCSSIGKKLLVSITGLGISAFALGHMSGNLLMFVSPEAYNIYGHGITHGPMFPLIESGLLLFFVAHLALALNLAWENKTSRGVKPARATNGQKAANLGSRWMVLTGLLVLVFLILHLKTFKFGTYYEATYNGLVVRDLFRLMHEEFQNPLYVAFYEFSLIVLFVHLRHGISSALQSLGIASSRNPGLQWFGWFFAFVVAGGFFIQPIYMMTLRGTP